MIKIIEKLLKKRSLSVEEYKFLIENRNDEYASLLADKAVEIRKEIYGNDVYIRGLIEISNICKNDCHYCGIRGGNRNCERFRLTKEQILSCCENGYSLGFRTFVMQGGEDAFYSDDIMCDIISEIKTKFPDCAITLSLGERSYESYQMLFDAGADRYLLRHEAANRKLYEKIHGSFWSNDFTFSLFDGRL